LKQETGITVTRSGIWLARQFVDTEDVPLKGVRRVEVGVYDVRGMKRGIDSPRPLDISGFKGWKPFVQIRDAGEQVFVLTKIDEQQRIRGMLVVVAEDDEWVLVRIRGKLDEIFERTMEMAFSQAERPELYARTREERGLVAADAQGSMSFSSQE
jgi:hypothetical protein